MVRGGTVVFTDALPGTSIAVQPADGGVQALVVIEEHSAPDSFEFTFDLPTGTSLKHLADGSVVALAESGAVVGTVAPPWAKDADGRDVPTRFVVEGSTINQIIEHAHGNYRYPIVADPCWSCIVSTVAGAVASAAKWIGGTLWSAAKWTAGGVKTVVGKGKVFFKKVGPFALALCVTGAGWAYFRSDADGWLRVADGVMGCFV